MKKKFDYSKLKGRIKEKLDTQQHFAEMLQISETALYGKLNNSTGFSQQDIIKTVAILDIDVAEISDYFFKIKVEENSTEEK